MTKMHILEDNDTFHFYNSLKINSELKPLNYVLNFNPFGFFLRLAPEFSLPSKIYDISKNDRDIIINRFRSSERNMGVLLTGKKGFGKTIDAKLICKELNLPVIMITEKIPAGFDFKTFINSIKQDFVLFIDEFDKIFASNNPASYDDENDETETGKSDSKNHGQLSFLNLMDGNYSGENKILFLFTTNSDVNKYLMNRPSRIKFVKHYNEFPMEVASMICDDLLINPNFKQDILDSVFEKYLSIDTIISIVNDVNAINKPYSTFSHIYNHRPEKFSYSIRIIDPNCKDEDPVDSEFWIFLDKPLGKDTMRINSYPVINFKMNNQLLTWDCIAGSKMLRLEARLRDD